MPFGLFEKGADVTLTLDKPQGPYYPGDVIHASVHTHADGNVKINQVRATLVRQQTTKGWTEQEDPQTHQKKLVESSSTDEQEVEKLVLVPGGQLSGDQTLTADLHIPPDAPPPYASERIQTRWIVKATVDRPMAGDNEATTDLNLVVPPPGTHGAGGEYGTTINPTLATLRFALPKLEFAPGEVLNGRLLVDPQQDSQPHEIRVLLVCHEHSTAGSQPDDGDIIDHMIELALRPQLKRGTRAEYPFLMLIAPKGHPTYQSPQASATWQLKAVLEPTDGSPSAEVQQEIYVYSGTRG